MRNKVTKFFNKNLPYFADFWQYIVIIVIFAIAAIFIL